MTPRRSRSAGSIKISGRRLAGSRSHSSTDCPSTTSRSCVSPVCPASNPCFREELGGADCHASSPPAHRSCHHGGQLAHRYPNAVSGCRAAEVSYWKASELLSSTTLARIRAPRVRPPLSRRGHPEVVDDHRAAAKPIWRISAPREELWRAPSVRFYPLVQRFHGTTRITRPYRSCRSIYG
jgi:hypothetical protein